MTPLRHFPPTNQGYLLAETILGTTIATARKINTAGVETYAPTLIGPHGKPIPAFGRYFWVRPNPALPTATTQWRFRWLYIHNRLYLFTDEEIEQLHTSEPSWNLPPKTPIAFNPGDDITITSGPFEHMTGTVVYAQPARLKVAINGSFYLWIPRTIAELA